MSKEYDYNKNICKMVGTDQEYTFDEPVVEEGVGIAISKVSTWGGKVHLHCGQTQYELEDLPHIMSITVFATIISVITKALENLVEMNKELLSLAGYDTKYYKGENWKKSFATYSINRLKETETQYKQQLERVKSWKE